MFEIIYYFPKASALAITDEPADTAKGKGGAKGANVKPPVKTVPKQKPEKAPKSTLDEKLCDVGKERTRYLQLMSKIETMLAQVQADKSFEFPESLKDLEHHKLDVGNFLTEWGLRFMVTTNNANLKRQHTEDQLLQLCCRFLELKPLVGKTERQFNKIMRMHQAGSSEAAATQKTE